MTQTQTDFVPRQILWELAAADCNAARVLAEEIAFELSVRSGRRVRLFYQHTDGFGDSARYVFQEWTEPKRPAKELV